MILKLWLCSFLRYLKTSSHLNICFNQKLSFCSCSVFHSALQNCIFFLFLGVLTFKAEQVVSHVVVSVCPRCEASYEKFGDTLWNRAPGGLGDREQHPEGMLAGSASAAQPYSEGIILVSLPFTFAPTSFPG